MNKIAIVGSRKYENKTKIKNFVFKLKERFGDDVEVISGGQKYGAEKNIPLDKIDIEYFIVKRKLYEKVDFPQRRVQTFIPANGTPSINKVTSELKSFIDECFIEGKHNKLYNYKKIATKKNCRWCEFRDKPDLCDRKN